MSGRKDNMPAEMKIISRTLPLPGAAGTEQTPTPGWGICLTRSHHEGIIREAQNVFPKGAHLDTRTTMCGKPATDAELESSANPQPGKAALRSTRFPACGFWR